MFSSLSLLNHAGSCLSNWRESSYYICLPSCMPSCTRTPWGLFRRVSIPLLQTLAQRQSFRTYLSGLLFPRDQSKTLTALVGAEPLIQPQAAEVQWLQVFCPRPPAVPKRSMPSAWRCWPPSQPLLRRLKGC